MIGPIEGVKMSESDLAGWMEVIRKSGEEYHKREDERADRMEAELPTAIAGLPQRENSELLALLCEFTGSRSSIRENKIRETFRTAVEAEILARMGDDQ